MEDISSKRGEGIIRKKFSENASLELFVSTRDRVGVREHFGVSMLRKCLVLVDLFGVMGVCATWFVSLVLSFIAESNNDRFGLTCLRKGVEEGVIPWFSIVPKGSIL